MMQWLFEQTGGLSAWTWLVAGAILMALEVFVPGFVFLWFGLAAAMTGLLAFIIGFSLQGQLWVFALLAVASLLVWWRLQKRLAPNAADPTLNERANRHIGREFVLTEPIISGHGRVKIDDSYWRVSGIDCPEGTKVTVFAVDGGTLMVRAAN